MSHLELIMGLGGEFEDDIRAERGCDCGCGAVEDWGEACFDPEGQEREWPHNDNQHGVESARREG